MASLAHCVDLHKTLIPREEMVALRTESRKLAMEKKIKPKEAMIQVVQSRIAETQVEYDKIADVIKEHYKAPEKKAPEKKAPEKKAPEKKAPEKKAIGHIELIKRYVKETGEKVEKGELDKVKARYPKEWLKIEKADDLKKELWDKLPESFRRNRGINEYTTKELEAMVAEPAKVEPVVISEEDYLAQKGAGRQAMGESALHKNILPGAAKERAIKRQAEKDRALIERRDELREEYKAKVKAGEIKKPTRIEALIETANGHPDVEATQAARRLLEKKGIEWKKVEPGKKAAPKKHPKKVVGQRSNKEGVEFYNPFNVKKRDKIIEGVEGSSTFRGKTQTFADGFFTQGFYAIKLPEAPETKKPLLTGNEAPNVKAVFPTENLIKAELIGELKTAKTKTTLVHVVDSEGTDHFFNAKYVDLILTKYPDATLFTAPAYIGTAAIFKVKGHPVGLVMSMNIEAIDVLEEIQKMAPDIKFSVAEGEERDLVAYHNLAARDLIAADNLGGIPMPSLAITKKDFPYTSFGDITMIGSKGMVDPEGAPNRVFNADVYSPTVPWKERDLKRKPFDELWNRLSSKIGDVGDYIYSLTEAAEKGYDQLLHFFDNSNGIKVAFLREQGIPIRIPHRDIGYNMPFSDTRAVQNFVKEYKGRIRDIKLHSPEHKIASDAIETGIREYAKDTEAEAGLSMEETIREYKDLYFDKEGYVFYGTTLMNLGKDQDNILKPKKKIDKGALRESLEKKFTKKVTARYLEWAKKQIDPIYGDPYLKLGRKKVDYTITNVFEAMHRQKIRGSQVLPTFGPAEARATGAKEFPTLAAARKHKAAIVSYDEFQKLKEKQDKKREDLTDALGKHYGYKDWRGEVDWWESINDSMKAIGSFLKNPKSRQSPGMMKACLNRRGFKDVPGKVLKDTTDFANTLRDMPTEYFEVKPERVLGIGEFSGAALPKNVDPIIKTILKKHGVPFKIYKTEADRQAVVVSFQRKKGVLFSEKPMYSALTRAAESPKFPANIPAKSVINQLRKAGGVKQVEIEVSGLSEWLEGKDKVAKADLVEFLRMTEVRVEEVEKGKGRGFKIQYEEDLDQYEVIDLETGDTVEVLETEEEAEEWVEAETPYQGDETKFAEYVLPGGEPASYRELVLRVPDKQPVPVGKIKVEEKENSYLVILGQHKIEVGKGIADSKQAAREYAEPLIIKKEIDAVERRSYKSAHWNEPNVVAHIRGDTRIIDGKKIFHVAEFQSDIYSRIVELEALEKAKPDVLWQKIYADGTPFGGRYSDKALAEEDVATINEGRTTSLVTLKEIKARPEAGKEWGLFSLDGTVVGEWYTSKSLADEAAAELNLKRTTNRIIVKRATEDEELANLKKLFPWGESWHELVAKKALEYAVKNNFDGITWDTAKTQVDRWEGALRKSVDEIEWNRRGESVLITTTKEGKKTLLDPIPLQGDTTIGGQRVTLNNLIGKELATKIRESSENSGTFEGKDLTIGGEFYKIIYDQKIPGFLKKYGKKWGAKVGRSKINNTPVHTINLTPTMQEAIETTGQALFAKTKKGAIKRLTVQTAKAEIAGHIGKKAVDALEKAEKVIFISKDDILGIVGYTPKGRVQGFYKDGTTYLIAENIDHGKAWGVLLHELGVHHGYEKIFGKKLAKEVFNAFTLKRYGDDKLGKAIAKAFDRIPEKTPFYFKSEEAVAYFTEENANIDLPLHRKIIARMRLWAVKYLGIKPDIFTFDDYVALAHGALRGEIKDAKKMPARGGTSREVFYSVPAWHGGPHAFDKFQTEKIGEGEGFQAFGWGLYFTDLEDIARNYAGMAKDKFLSYGGKQVTYDDFANKISKEYGEEYQGLAARIIYDFRTGFLPDDILRNVEQFDASDYTIAKKIVSKMEHISLENVNRWVVGIEGGIEIENKMSAAEHAALFDIQGRVGWYSKNTKDPLSKVKDELERTVKAQKERLNTYPENKSEAKRIIEGAEDALDVIEKYNLEANFVEPMRNLYKVTLHEGKEPKEYEWLEWEDGVKEVQIKKIEDQAKKEGLNIGDKRAWEREREIIKKYGTFEILLRESYKSEFDEQDTEKEAAKDQARVTAIRTQEGIYRNLIPESELKIKPNMKSKYATPEVIAAVKDVGYTEGELTLMVENDGSAYRSIMDKFPEMVEDEEWAVNVVVDVFATDTRPKPIKNNILYAELSVLLGSDKEASLFLLRAGIDGIKYPTGSLTGQRQEGASNYVVFDEEAVSIDEHTRYSVAEQKDLRAWADDLIKSTKDPNFVLDTQKTSPEEIRETSLSILSGLDLKKLNQPARSFIQGLSPKGKGIGQAIGKWIVSPEWYKHSVLKKIVGYALDKSEKFHTTFNEFNAVDDPMAEHDTVAKSLEALARKGKISKAAFILGRTSTDFKKLETLLDDADVYGEKHTVKELEEKGYSKDVVQAWSVVRESYDKQLEALIKPMRDLVARIKEQAAFMGTEPIYPDFGDFIIEGKKRRLTLQEAVMEMGRYKGTYSPRIRDRGAWVITGRKKKTVVEGGNEYVRYNRKTKSFANLLRDKLAKEGFTDIKIEKESRLPEETFQAIRMAEMGTMIGHAAHKGLDKYDGEQQMAFMDDIITASADMIKSRGARATMIKRREGLAVKGYITNPLVRFVRYTGTTAAGIAKAEMAQGMIKALYGEYINGKKVGGLDATKEGEIHSLARAYIEEQLRNAETGDRIVGVMKALTTFKFLGFNPRSVLVNLSSLATSVPLSLHTYVMDGKGSLLKIGKVLSGGCKDYTRVMAGKRLKNVDEQDFIDGFRDSGYTDAQYTRDAMGNIQGAYGTMWSKAMGGSMYVFGKSEEWVRGGTALAAFRLAKKQGLSNTAAKEKAIKGTAKAHGTYGKETLPMVAWGKGIGRLGQAFYTYMKFPHNYLQMLYDAGIRKKNMKGVIFGIAAPAVLGGVTAVPMYYTVMAIAGAMLSAIGDDRDPEKLVYDTLNEHIGKTGEEAIRGGVLGLVDIDISGSLAMGPGSIPTSLFDLTGAVGGMVQDIYKGAGHVVGGELGRAAEKLLPKAVGNIFTAIREIEGAYTSRGNRIWDDQGQPYMPETTETIKRGLGFRSARRALLAQSTWVSKKEEQRFKKTASDIYKKIRFLTGRSEDVRINQDVKDKISDYNQNALKTSNISLITPASIERQLERMKTPTTKQRARVTASERICTFEGSIWGHTLGVVDKPDAVQLEVKRLSDAGILKYSAPPSRAINAGYGVKVKLDNDQYRRYTADESTIIKKACDRMVSGARWKNWTDKQRAFVIKRVINEGRKIVRDRLKITILKTRLKEK